MTYASYERQHLAMYAAGFISGDGLTRQGFGCELTRVGTGVYAIVLGADAGLVSDESYTFVTAKTQLGTSGAPRTLLSVEDTSNLVKTIFASGVSFAAAGITIARTNVDLEVALYRTVTRQNV